MPEFRYYCLHDDGSIALGEHLEATDLNTAIEHTYAVAGSHPNGPFPHVEVWSGKQKLYASLREQKDERRDSCPA
jgi:hypothetical protein